MKREGVTPTYYPISVDGIRSEIMVVCVRLCCVLDLVPLSLCHLQSTVTITTPTIITLMIVPCVVSTDNSRFSGFVKTVLFTVLV